MGHTCKCKQLFLDCSQLILSQTLVPLKNDELLSIRDGYCSFRVSSLDQKRYLVMFRTWPPTEIV